MLRIVLATLALGSVAADYTRWVIYKNTSSCEPSRWDYINYEKLGECYFSGPTSWTNNCTGTGAIERTFYDDYSSPARRCGGKLLNTSKIETAKCTAYQGSPTWSQEYLCFAGEPPRSLAKSGSEGTKPPEV